MRHGRKEPINSLDWPLRDVEVILNVYLSKKDILRIDILGTSCEICFGECKTPVALSQHLSQLGNEL